MRASHNPNSAVPSPAFFLLLTEKTKCNRLACSSLIQIHDSTMRRFPGIHPKSKVADGKLQIERLTNGRHMSQFLNSDGTCNR